MAAKGRKGPQGRKGLKPVMAEIVCMRRIGVLRMRSTRAWGTWCASRKRPLRYDQLAKWSVATQPACANPKVRVRIVVEEDWKRLMRMVRGRREHGEREGRGEDAEADSAPADEGVEAAGEYRCGGAAGALGKSVHRAEETPHGHGRDDPRR